MIAMRVPDKVQPRVRQDGYRSSWRALLLLLLCGICLASAGLGGCVHSAPVTPPAPPPTKDWTITATWNYDFTNFKPCSATLTSGCISGFTWGYMLGTTQVAIKTSAPSVCTGSTQPETCTDTGNSTLGIGTVTMYCVADYVDNSGNAGATASSTFSDQVQAALVTNLTVTQK
jgi:hypothetical protein